MGRLVNPVRRLMIVGLVLIVPALLVGCDRLPGSSADLKVGDCFMEPGGEGEVGEVQRRACDEAHDAEVFAVLAYEGETYPIELTLDRFIDEECLPQFEVFTGTAFGTQSELTVGWFYPTREGWNGGDRDITCYLIRSDGGHLTGSQRAAG
ncbi:MAG TPA: septum formation family protein [Candidatus Limnocylindria bacterium]|nr:septum formation family protein [Candidatus Limnocylindria bacterium]